MLLCQMRDSNGMNRGNALTQTGATQYHAQLGHPDKGLAIKGLVICNDILLYVYSNNYYLVNRFNIETKYFLSR